MEILQKLTDGGNTVLVIEHNLDVIKAQAILLTSDRKAAKRAERSLRRETPEEVAENQASYTGIYVKKMLERDK